MYGHEGLCAQPDRAYIALGNGGVGRHWYRCYLSQNEPATAICSPITLFTLMSGLAICVIEICFAFDEYLLLPRPMVQAGGARCRDLAERSEGSHLAAPA